MNPFKNTLSALLLGGSLAISGIAFAQDDAAAPAPVEPDPEAQAAENMEQLLEFVVRARFPIRAPTRSGSAALQRPCPSRSSFCATQRRSARGRKTVLRSSKTSLKRTSC